MSDLIVGLDSRIHIPDGLPSDFIRDLKKGFVHSNPEFHKRANSGYSTWNVDRTIVTWEDDERGLTLPRGGTRRLKDLARSYGYRLRMMDKRTTAPVTFPRFVVDPDHPNWVLMAHQLEQVAASVHRQQGVARAPTGSGKTIGALALIHEVGQRAVVIVRDNNLLKQWLLVATGCLGLDPKEIGIIRGGRKFKFGPRLTLAMQQTLYARREELAAMLVEDPIGIVIIDEVQTLAARTFGDVIDVFPSRMRIGFSADETRRDKKEFLIYDAMGEVIHEIDRTTMEERGIILPVTVRVEETNFRADWYRGAEPRERDFGRLIEEMTADSDRNDVLLDLMTDIEGDRGGPTLVFTHRREHATDLADRYMPYRGMKCGLLIGGAGADGIRFDEDRARLDAGEVEIAVGTFSAIGQGINLPSVQSGVCSTPISIKNKQLFNQVRGRICRTSEGKLSAFLYYLWDKEVFPGQMRALMKWNDGRVEERGPDGGWVPVTSAR